MTEPPTQLLTEAYAATTHVVRALSSADFDARTRTVAWSVRDLLYHQVLDAQRALVALATSTSEDADVDAASYWRPFRPGAGDGGSEHARFVQVVAAAFSSTADLVSLWTGTSLAVARTAAAADPSLRVRTQGHVITIADLASTLVVEATVHLLDLTLEVPGAPTPGSLAHTRGVLERIHGGPLPVHWDNVTAALRATGRARLDTVDRIALGDTADALPLLG